MLRFWNLGQPRDFLFDETYYAKDGWSLWRYGYGISWRDDANEAILEGRLTPDLTRATPRWSSTPRWASG